MVCVCVSPWLGPSLLQCPLGGQKSVLLLMPSCAWTVSDIPFCSNVLSHLAPLIFIISILLFHGEKRTKPGNQAVPWWNDNKANDIDLITYSPHFHVCLLCSAVIRTYVVEAASQWASGDPGKIGLTVVWVCLSWWIFLVKGGRSVFPPKGKLALQNIKLQAAN